MAGEAPMGKIGLGTWAWGDAAYWRYGEAFGPSELVEAFVAGVEAGVTFFDTAEVYGHGESEKILGFMAQKHAEPLFIATKFALLEGRPGAKVLRRALEASLRRLRRPRVELYQVHWCDTEMASIESLMEAMADCVKDGLVGEVGVSNFSADETRRAHEALSRRGLRLYSNQVRYSLLHRAPEADGVAEACRDTGALLLAYSPLEQGVLAGRYLEGTPPGGRRGQQPWFRPEALAEARPLVEALARIGRDKGVGPAEVALRWLIDRPGVVPIAGVTRAEHARSAARALSIELTGAERDSIDEASRGFVRPSRVE